MAGPETVLRAATHGLILGALREDGPLPRELEKLRNQVRPGECLTAYTVDDLKWGGERMLGLRTQELLVLPPTPHPGPNKQSWLVVQETHQVLDKLFPKFLKGNILQPPWSEAFSPGILPTPTPSAWEMIDLGSLCELKPGPQVPCL